MFREEKLSVDTSMRILELEAKTITPEQAEETRKDLLARRKYGPQSQKQKLDNELLKIAYSFPVNEIEPFSLEKSTTFTPEKGAFATVDGWVFSLEDLVNWIKTRGEWRHPTNPDYKFDPADKERITQLARTKFNIDLSDKNLNPRQYTKELEEDADEEMNGPLIARLTSAASEIKSDASSDFPIPNYDVNSSVILDLAILFHREPQFLVDFEARNSQQFDTILTLQDYARIDRLKWDDLAKIPKECVASMVCAFPYVKEKLISLDEAKQFNENEITILRRVDINPDKNSLKARLQIVRPEKSRGGFLTQDKELKVLAEITGIPCIDLGIYCRQNPNGLITLQNNVEKLISYMPDIICEKLTIEKALKMPLPSPAFFSKTKPKPSEQKSFPEVKEVAEITGISEAMLNEYCSENEKGGSRLSDEVEKLLAASACVRNSDMSVKEALDLKQDQVQYLQTVDDEKMSTSDIAAVCKAMNTFASYSPR